MNFDIFDALAEVAVMIFGLCGCFPLGCLLYKRKRNFIRNLVLSALLMIFCGMFFYFVKKLMIYLEVGYANQALIHLIWYVGCNIPIVFCLFSLFRFTLNEGLFCFVAGNLITGVANGLYNQISALLALAVNVKEWLDFLIRVGVFVSVFLLFFILYRLLKRKGKLDIKVTNNTWLAISFLLIYIVSEVVHYSISAAYAVASTRDGLFLLLPIIPSLNCCILLLLLINMVNLNSLQNEKQIQDHILREKENQYDLTSETIDIINRKCHDLKKQISVLMDMGDKQRQEQFSEISKTINIYETIVHTDNKILDTLLTEKYLRCKEAKITLSCMVDGKVVDFVEPIDLYTMMVNALDNAIEACLKQEEDKRSITLTIKETMGFAHIIVINSYDGKVLMSDSVIQTTKRNSDHMHGYGLKSIKYIVKKYEGDCKISYDNDFFTLSILLPAV